MPLRAPNLKLPTYLNQVADVQCRFLLPPKWITTNCNERSTFTSRPTGEDLGKPQPEISQNRRIDADFHPTSSQHSRLGDHHAILVPEFWLRPSSLGPLARLSSSGRPVLRRSLILSDRAGRSDRTRRRNAHLGFHGHDSEHPVAHGNRDAHRHGRFEQHFDRRFRQPASRAKDAIVRDAVAHSCRIRLRPILMTSLATIVGLLPDGVEAGNGQRSLRSARASDHRRTASFRSCSPSSWSQPHI